MTNLATAVEIARANYQEARRRYEGSTGEERERAELEYVRTFNEWQQAIDEYWTAQPSHDRKIRMVALWEAHEYWSHKWERGNKRAAEETANTPRCEPHGCMQPCPICIENPPN